MYDIFQTLLLEEYRALTENLIPLKPVLGAPEFSWAESMTQIIYGSEGMHNGSELHAFYHDCKECFKFASRPDK